MSEFKVAPANASAGVKLLTWVDNRFPASQLWKEHLSEYYAPKNFNFWYVFGSLALLVLVIQIVTGIFLVMHYKPDATLAFASVEYIMRDVPWGWLVRYMHSTGASAFFVVVYMHMFRGFLYGSYRKPRELVWIFGCAIFLCLMGEAFMGYLLPWGQLSYWGAQVIVYVVSDATLNRFFSFHVIAIPLILLGLVVAHIIALHEVGSNNPDGVEIKKDKDANGIPKDGIPFHPYYTVHDLLAVVSFLILFSAVVFFAPEMGGYFLEFNNFIPADSLKTPPHIAPVWYFTPFYSMLRATTDDMLVWFRWIVGIAALLALWKGRFGVIGKAIIVIGAVALLIGFGTLKSTHIGALQGCDAKFWGVLVMGGSVVILFFMPWLDQSPVRSIRYRPHWHKAVLLVFVAVFMILGYLGIEPPDPLKTALSQVGTLLYFGFFLLMPWWSQMGTFKPVPDRVTFHAH
jgi:ubiquinol-cytochrome c reductase cytochrome b subunit